VNIQQFIIVGSRSDNGQYLIKSMEEDARPNIMWANLVPDAYHTIGDVVHAEITLEVVPSRQEA
jgi:hypothetical protein